VTFAKPFFSLTQNLKDFLDDAKDGAILFSFGSNAKSMYLPEEKVRALLNVFSKLKQRVVMKWESDTLPGKPDNVIISKWLPQDDVLAHPSIKLFISHCGYGGVIEAKHNGVPIVGVPLGGDQSSNADKIVEEGWAIRIDFDDLNEVTLTRAVEEILSNGKYAEVVKRESILSRDRPMNAQETAIYWVEYVLRHRGAPHMHFPSADLNFFQDNSIDVMLVVAGTLYIVFKLLKVVSTFAFCRRRKAEGKLKRN
jgi:glucuronosyltransferase